MAVPKLRFTGFDGDYLELSYDKFAPLQRGFDLPVSTIVEGDYPVVFSNGILKKHNEFKAQAPGVVTGRSGTIGNITWVEKDYWPHNTSLWVTNFFDNEPKYVFYFLQKFDVSRFASGSGVPTLNRNDVHAQLITISPERREQTKIASFLSAVDEKISQLTQKHQLLSQYKQGMMQKLFSQQLRFKADDGSEFREWEEKELKDIAEINPKSKKLPESFIYIDLESVEKGKLLLQKNIELQDAPSRAQRLLAKGDVLFQMVRPYQQNNYYFNLSGEYVASTGYAQIRTKLDSKFIYYALHEKTFLDEVMNRCTGTSYPAINSSDLSSIEILIPCLEEQTKIANFLSSIDQKIEVVAQQIEQAKQWKKGLLQNMFI